MEMEAEFAVLECKAKKQGDRLGTGSPSEPPTGANSANILMFGLLTPRL